MNELTIDEGDSLIGLLCRYRTNEDQIGADADSFFVTFFARYPFLKGGLYLAGESYAGKYLPAIGMEALYVSEGVAQYLSAAGCLLVYSVVRHV